MSIKKTDLTMKFVEGVQKDWKIITTIFTIVAGGITIGMRLANRVSAYHETVTSLQSDQQTDEQSADQQDKWLDNLEKRVTVLEEDERLREKGICK